MLFYASVPFLTFSATQIRAWFGLAWFAVPVLVARHGRALVGLVGNSFSLASTASVADAARRRALRGAFLILAVGALVGPFLGVSLALLSTQLLPTGTASTLMAIVPVLLIPAAVLVFRERVSVGEVVGALLAVAGGAVLVGSS